MSLYQMQKFLFEVNRDPALQSAFKADRDAVLARYRLSDEEQTALRDGDVGLVYVLGANGQLLMHFAALIGMAWPDYLQAMRDGVQKYGPVRAGVYTMTTAMDEKVAGL